MVKINCNSCKFYDNGHGNGSYMSGACCNPPSCKHPKNTKDLIPNIEPRPNWCPKLKTNKL